MSCMLQAKSPPSGMGGGVAYEIEPRFISSLGNPSYLVGLGEVNSIMLLRALVSCSTMAFLLALLAVRGTWYRGT